MIRRLLGVLAAVGLLAGCALPTPVAESAPPSRATVAGPLTIYAAAALSAPLAEVGTIFESQHPQVEINFVIAEEADLVARLKAGEPGDLLVVDTEEGFYAASDAGLLIGNMLQFASEPPVLVVVPANPAQIRGLEDLARPGVRLASCFDHLQCGNFVPQLAQEAGINLPVLNPDEPRTPMGTDGSVEDVIARVIAGEADVGALPRRSAQAAADQVVLIPLAVDAVAGQSFASILGSVQNYRAAEVFSKFLATPEAWEALRS